MNPTKNTKVAGTHYDMKPYHETIQIIEDVVTR